MKIIRECSKPYCHRQAVATLTYVYSDATLVLGPMATTAEPHSYDLCQHHVDTLKAPRGWTVHQLTTDFVPAAPHDDDLDALAQIVRKASKRHVTPVEQTGFNSPGEGAGVFGAARRSAPVQRDVWKKDPTEVKRVGHLRVLQGEGGTDDGEEDNR